MSRCSIQAFVPEEHKSGSRRSRITVRPPHSPVRLPSHPRCALAASGSAASASSRRPERLFAELSCEGRSCAVNRPRRRHWGGEGGRRRGRRRDATFAWSPRCTDAATGTTLTCAGVILAGGQTVRNLTLFVRVLAGTAAVALTDVAPPLGVRLRVLRRRDSPVLLTGDAAPRGPGALSLLWRRAVKGFCSEHARPVKQARSRFPPSSPGR